MEDHASAAHNLKPESNIKYYPEKEQSFDNSNYLNEIANKGIGPDLSDEESDSEFTKHSTKERSQRKASRAQETAFDDSQICVDRKLSEEDSRSSTQIPNSAQKEKLEVLKTEKYKYIGFTLNGLRHGFGVCYYNNGAVHLGQWRLNKKQGFGSTTFANGQTIVGELANNCYDGFAELSCGDKLKVTGFCQNGFFRGEVVINKDKLLIEGIDLSCLSTQSLCKIIYSNNQHFLGTIDASNSKLQTGFGILVYKKQYVYMGDFVDFKFNGYGEFYKANGSKFYGTYVNHMKQGIGFYYNKEFMGFGNFQDNLKHGPFYLVRKNSVRLEMYYMGFSCKIVEKADTIKKYINLNYPEYKYVLHANLAGILNKFLSLNENQEIMAEVIVDKEKADKKPEKTEKTETQEKEKSKENVAEEDSK